MFDSAELNAVYNAARRGVSKYKGAHATALLAVAAHVRAMTLREAAGVCEKIRKKHMSPGERFIDPFDIGVNATGATCRDELIALAEADATGKDGVS